MANIFRGWPRGLSPMVFIIKLYFFPFLIFCHLYTVNFLLKAKTNLICGWFIGGTHCSIWIHLVCMFRIFVLLHDEICLNTFDTFVGSEQNKHFCTPSQIQAKGWPHSYFFHFISSVLKYRVPVRTKMQNELITTC